jgi:multisubunit Na+/H+ antiporter MnhF subunit
MDIRNVGGTPGGTKTFLLGLIMAIAGGYLLLQQVQVHGGYWFWAGGYGKSFGLTLIPLLLGIGILFTNGKSIIGRVLTAGGALVILVGIIANLDIHFRQTSLWNTILILVLLVGGIGLVVRSVMPMVERGERGERGDDRPPRDD